ncbi:unnamed protein product (macronuclear) [Paramecium tetraurelia]|uniref:PDIA6-like C-terminal thioredoxin-like domain-containing protein n=1 Tax=Paramecium tetraurelia TaxID=5888 RepID=A0BZF5_PARTE|nr:uncharacterized protein GSPATT00033775001 [Paramecium tetraurelia]CAK63922.1 unnamed protein product [Paramecium tetraurelia]|eukprot:XP_001431320.1 hypothetical protein (macronuclear) [Paramecium tetraurelia strain d4-2]
MNKFILIALLTLSTQALFENSYTIKSANKMQDFRAILESDFVSLVYFYTEECENCQMAASLVEKVAEDQEGIINVFGANCDQINKDPNSVNKLPYCSEDMLEQLPQISFFEPPQFKINPYTKEPMIATEHRFQGEASPQSLGTFGHKFIPNHVIRINTLEELKQFETTDPKLNKVLLFTKKKETSPILKSLNLHYFERVKFGEIIASPETQSLLDQFDIKDLPQIIGLENNGDNTYNHDIFDGDLLFKPIKKFVRSLASKDRVPYEQVNEKPKEDNRRNRRNKQNDQEEDTQKPVVITPTKLDLSVLNKQLLRNDKPALVHVYKDQMHKAWDDSLKKYKSLFDYYELQVDTQQDEELAKELFIKSYPSIRFYQVGNAGKKKSNKISFTKEYKIEEINKDIQDLIDDKTININEQTLQMQLSQFIADNNIVVIYFYQTPIVGLTYRVLSQLQEYYGKYKFLSFKNAPEMVIKQFQIPSQPAITIIFREVADKKELEEELKPEQVRQALFTGKHSYEEIKSFIDSFDETKKTSHKKVIEISTQEQLLEQCNKKQKLCYIALLNGEHKQQKHDEILTKWEYQLEVLDRIKNAHGDKQASFVYIDASCHDEVLLKFDISDDSLPNFVAYSNAKKIYSKLIGRFDYESINKFIERQYKGQSNNIQIHELEILERDCEEVFQKRKEASQKSGLSDFDEEILKEILEEEKQRKKELEKELKKGKKKNKKSKDEL